VHKPRESLYWKCRRTKGNLGNHLAGTTVQLLEGAQLYKSPEARLNVYILQKGHKRKTKLN
jgi:hypothetical protein